MKNFDKQSALWFGSCMTVFYVVQSFCLNEEYAGTHDIPKYVISSVVGGIISGLLFGLVLGWMNNSRLTIPGSVPVIVPGEKMLKQGVANHYKGIEAVGGTLVLTDQRLAYKSHKFNIQRHEWSVLLSEIERVEKRRILGLWNTGMNVTLKNKKIERFVVQKPQEWVDRLNLLIGTQDFKTIN